jgi:hypothetical protein
MATPLILSAWLNTLSTIVGFSKGLQGTTRTRIKARNPWQWSLPSPSKWGRTAGMIF